MAASADFIVARIGPIAGVDPFCPIRDNIISTVAVMEILMEMNCKNRSFNLAERLLKSVLKHFSRLSVGSSLYL